MPHPILARDLFLSFIGSDFHPAPSAYSEYYAVPVFLI
jgi:hypothetical protein